MPATDFIQELRALGYEVDESPVPQLQGNVVVRFPFQIPLGSRAGEEITLGFIVPPDYPMTCPSGPYMSPLVLPLNTSTSEPPYGGVSDASGTFGQEWEYWSRPYNDWAQSERNARAYMRHIKHLFHLI
jgi:E2/UBC family protein E